MRGHQSVMSIAQKHQKSTINPGVYTLAGSDPLSARVYTPPPDGGSANLRGAGVPAVADPQEVEPSLLGNIRDCLLPSVEPVSVRRLHLMGLQQTAALLANNSRLASCLRVPLDKFAAVQLRRSPQGVMYFDGLMRCGLPWLCPPCSSKISELRRLELERGVNHWVSGGHAVAMVTYTVRHDASMPLQRVLQGLQSALDTFNAGENYSKLKSRYGVAGGVHALEVTQGANGWHVHRHELVALVGDAGLDYTSMEFDYLSRWLHSLDRVGLSGNEHALDLVAGSQASAKFQARYVAKFEKLPSGRWSIEHEIAKSISKRSAGSNRSPLELLMLADMGDVEGGELWQEYACAFRGKRHLRFTKGLRSLFGLGADPSDGQLANARGSGELVALVSGPSWSRVLAGGDRRGDLLRVAVHGQGAINQYLGGA